MEHSNRDPAYTVLIWTYFQGSGSDPKWVSSLQIKTEEYGRFLLPGVNIFRIRSVVMHL